MFNFLLSEAARLANAITLGKERITDEQYVVNEINHFKISQRRKEMIDGERYHIVIDINYKKKKYKIQNKFPSNSKEYRILKNNWKLLLHNNRKWNN